MSWHGAQLNNDNICICTSWLSEPAEGLIEIPDNFSPLGMRYNFVTKEWEAPIIEEEVMAAPPPSLERY